MSPLDLRIRNKILPLIHACLSGKPLTENLWVFYKWRTLLQKKEMTLRHAAALFNWKRHGADMQWRTQENETYPTVTHKRLPVCSPNNSVMFTSDQAGTKKIVLYSTYRTAVHWFILFSLFWITITFFFFFGLNIWEKPPNVHQHRIVRLSLSCTF